MSEETNHIDGDKPAVPSNPLLGLYPKYDAKTVTMYHKTHRTNKTGFLGVIHRKTRGVFEARIRVHGKKEKIHIGTAKTAEEAAHLYDDKARELYGDGAVTNFDKPNPSVDARQATQQTKESR